MIKRILLVILLATIVMPAPSIVYADDEISLLESTAEVYFPSALSFTIKAESSKDITRIRLHYQVDKMNYADVVSEAWPIFVPAPKVETKWIWDMRKASLPSGATLHYWWTIENETGNKLITPAASVSFDDKRYPWQELSSGQLTLFWYEGSQSFADELMAASQQAITRLARDTGAMLESPVKIYLYASTRDLQGSMIFPREWTGGVAFTEYSIIAIGVSPKDLDWGKDALAHELGHMVTHQITFSPYGADLPTWLDEGLAVYTESNPSPTFQTRLKKAVSEQRLISVRSLSSPFSANPDEAYLSYAQSHSVVTFLIQNHGQSKMLRLLTLLKEGNSCDEALTEIYGFDQDGLDELWQQSLTASGEPVEQEQLNPLLSGLLLALIILVVISTASGLGIWSWRRYRAKAASAEGK